MVSDCRASAPFPKRADLYVHDGRTTTQIADMCGMITLASGREPPTTNCLSDEGALLSPKRMPRSTRRGVAVDPCAALLSEEPDRGTAPWLHQNAIGMTVAQRSLRTIKLTAATGTLAALPGAQRQVDTASVQR